jgi:hypothetical protein
MFQSATQEPLDSLSSEELRRFTAVETPFQGETLAQRYRYEALQFLAPFQDELPDPRAFIRVRCRDLSSGGLSYFAKELPDYEWQVVSLGNLPNRAFFVAEVEHCRSVFMYGNMGHLIGCRFVKRLGGIYTWDERSDTIVRSRQEQSTAV